MIKTPRPSGGFTLIELLVVITIILLLASWGVTRFIAAQRDAELAKSEDNLSQIYFHLKRYEEKKRRLPSQSGPDFLLAIWGKPFLEKTKNNAQIFFCPSLSAPPLTDDEEVLEEWVNAENISYTGRNQADKEFRVGRTTQAGASKIIIACNKPIVNGEIPHHGQYLAVVYLNGVTGHLEANLWGEDPDLLVVGPDSPVEAVRGIAWEEL